MTSSHIRSSVCLLLTASFTLAAAVDPNVVQVANWLVGSFVSGPPALDAGTQAVPGKQARMTARPLQDPVAFGDGLYIYAETRFDDQPGTLRQQVLRLKKSGRRVRVEQLRIDGQVLAPLASDPQMLGNLAPGDLTKERGCDLLLEPKGDEYVGSITGRSCKFAEVASAYRTMSLRLTKDLIVILERGFDDRDAQTFGPTDGRGQEFRRILQ